MTVPANLAFYETRIPLGSGPGALLADISGGIDVATGIASWTLTAIDPATGLPPVGALQGLLPPDDATGSGEGFVTYTVNAKAGAPTGSVIANAASITFDTNAPMSTNTVTNTLDAVAPTSAVTPLPASVSTLSFTVNWSGQDDANGSGVAGYDIYVMEDQGPWVPWQSLATTTSAVFTGVSGHSYSFASRAHDNAGNIEAMHAAPDTTVLIDPALQLAFTSQPGNALADSLLPALTVAVQDAAGNTAPDAVNAVTITALPTTGNPLLLDTMNAVNGVATFANLLITTPGSYTLQASATGLTGATSDAFTILPAPLAILSFTPAGGGTNTLVTISGTGFTGATAVAFGGTAAASFTVVNDTCITATVGSGATGAITVTTPGGTATSPGTFSYSLLPIITGVTPSSGSPGTTVTINGANFSGVTGVYFSGTPAASFSVNVNSIAITATIPSDAPSGPITVTDSAGTAASATFTVILLPAIAGFTPTSGGTGAVVTLTGTNFTGATAVAFGGVAAASFSVTNATTISATVGNGATGTVTVTTPFGTASSPGTFTYNPPPTITGFTPSSGGTGAIITLTGTNFTGATAVAFGGVAATSFSITNATTISATLGSGATGTITVTTPGGAAASPGTFTYYPPPTVTGFTPSSGGTNTVVTLTGSGFTGASAVAFGGTAASAITVVDDSTISATVGNGATGTVTVTTPFGTASSPGTFTFYPPPTVIGFTPASAGPGMSITITGTNFIGVSAITMGGVPATYFTVVSSTTIIAIVGSGASGPIVITMPGGSLQIPGTFTFIPAPAITGFTPSSGGTNTVVSITGSNFTGATAVAFGGTPAAAFSVVSATSISATVGNGVTGTITITTPGGMATSSGTFAYYPPPTITTFTPSSGETTMLVTITGTGFTGATAVAFGGTAAASFTIVNDTTITATLGNGATGKVTITTPGGTAASPGTFTYNLSLTGLTVTTTPTSPQTVNTAITITATATGGMNVQYQFWLYNAIATPAWSQLQPYSTQTTCPWAPATAGSYQLSITAQDGATGATVNKMVPYIITAAAPTITSFTPASGGTNTVVTITGAGFTGATAVAFGGTAAVSFTVINDTTITATVAGGATGAVSVTTPVGTATSSSAFSYTPNHQADSNDDWQIDINEMTAYGAAWKSGKSWTVAPADIPIAYMTNAGDIWKTGQVYYYDASLTAPLCWVPGTSLAKGTPRRSLASAKVTRALSATRTCGAPITVTLAVAPTAGGHCYAVEDAVPSGWVVSGISGGGACLAGKVKWGPFFDAQARTLSYQLAPGHSAPGSYALQGTASVDGGNLALPRGTLSVALAAHQPDLTIRAASASTYLGAGILNRTGAGQTAESLVKDGAAASYVIQVSNAGMTADRFTLTAPAGGAGWSVSYRDLAGGADITKQLTGAGWTTGTLAAGAAASIAVSVTPTAWVKPGSSNTLLVFAISAADDAQADAVKAVTITLP